MGLLSGYRAGDSRLLDNSHISLSPEYDQRRFVRFPDFVSSVLFERGASARATETATIASRNAKSILRFIFPPAFHYFLVSGTDLRSFPAGSAEGRGEHRENLILFGWRACKSSDRTDAERRKKPANTISCV